MAGGFMAGFGSAFSQAYQSGVDAAREKESDDFKLRFTDYVSRRDKLEAQNKINEKNIKTARRIAQMTGQPADAWGPAYDMLSGGASFDDVYKLYQNNQASISPRDATQTQNDTGEKAQPEGDLTANASNSVDAQMRASGMQTPPDGGVFAGAARAVGGTNQQEEQTPAVPVGNTGEMHQNQRPSPVDERIAGVTGTTADKVAQTMNASMPADPVPSDDDYQITWAPKSGGGLKPEWSKISNFGDATYALTWAQKYGSKDELALAQSLYDSYSKAGAEQAKQKAISEGTWQGDPTRGRMIDEKTGKATGPMVYATKDRNGETVWRDPEGRVVDQTQFMPFDARMEKELGEISKSTGKQVQEYNDAVISFKDLSRTSQDLVALSKAYPQAMGISGDIFQKFDSVKRAVVNVASVLSPQVDPQTGLINVPDGAVSKLADAERKVMDEMKGPIDQAEKLALAAALMDIKATKLAYLMAEQSGAGEGRAISNKDFDNFKAGAIGNGNPEALRLSTADMIRQKAQKLRDMETNLNSYGSGLRHFEERYQTTSPDRPVASIDDIIAGDPQLQRIMEEVTGAQEKNSLTQTKQGGLTKGPDGKIQYPTEGVPAGIDPGDWYYMDEKDKKKWQ